MFTRHFKISSDNLFELLDSFSFPTFGVLHSSNFASFDEFLKVFAILSVSTGFNLG